MNQTPRVPVLDHEDEPLGVGTEVIIIHKNHAYVNAPGRITKLEQVRQIRKNSDRPAYRWFVWIRIGTGPDSFTTRAHHRSVKVLH